MLQACLEQYLVVGADGVRVVDEAFAWGYKVHKTEKEEDDMEIDGEHAETEVVDGEVNDMFGDPVYENEVEGWSGIKQQYLDLLFPPPAAKSEKDTYSVPSSEGDDAQAAKASSVDLVSHLEMTAAHHSISTFESTLLSFLAALSESVPKPVLVQLEAGKLDGMSEKQTAEFVRSCGLSVARFWETPVGFKGT